MNNKIIVAIDSDHLNNSIKLVKKIKKEIFAIKIGYEFFFNFGVKGYKTLHKIVPNIFLDLKMHDIPNTVGNAIKGIEKLNPIFTTIHLSGGDKMQQIALNESKKTKIIGVSILTSLNSKQTKKFYNKKIEELVENLVKSAIKNKLHGLVCSPKEIKIVKKLAGDKLIIITPGIRPINYLNKKDDQKRTLTPKQAIDRGADYLVIGRPITKSKNPLATIIQINKTLN